MVDRLGVAVVGCGRISRSHLAAVAAHADGASLVAAVDQDRMLAEEAATRYGARLALTDLDAALRHPEVDAVVICLPNRLHAPVALRAMEAGKHVLVEKPMAETAREASEMAASAARHGVTLAVAQCRRYFRAVRHLLEHQGDFGPLISAQVSLGVHWGDAQAPWWRDPAQAAGLVVALNGPHVLDFVQAVMQDDPVRVSAEAVRRRSYWAGEDEAMMLLAYPGHRLASVHLSFNQRPVENRKVLVYDKGTAIIEADRMLTFNGDVLVPMSDEEGRHYLDEAIEFKRQFVDFVAAVRGLPNRAVTAGEGVRLMRTLDAVQSALRANAGRDDRPDRERLSA